MFMGSRMNSLCLKIHHRFFYDNIITASHLFMQKHISYNHHNHDVKAKGIHGWDIEIDIARDKTMFLLRIWRDCRNVYICVLHNIMKKTRSTYPYMLRALKYIAKLKNLFHNPCLRLITRVIGNQPLQFVSTTLTVQMW